MGDKYGHLDLWEREQLFLLREQGKTFREIGKKLGRSHTSLSREYKRHSKYGRRYKPCKAQEKSEKIGLEQRSKCPLKNHLIFVYVRKKLRDEGWSPEQISGRLPIDMPGERICVETIYQYIYNQRKSGRDKLWRYLSRHRKRRMKQYGRKVKREPIPERTMIDSRPEEILGRTTLGHWETDLMEGKKSDRLVVSATVERKTRYTVLSLLQGKTAQEKKLSLIERMGEFPQTVLKTITTDNGKENSYHQQVTKELGIPVYFCRPYHSWEKGTVENTIGRVRKYLPKHQTLDTVTKTFLQSIENKLNNTPRKCLHFLTPNEALLLELLKQ